MTSWGPQDGHQWRRPEPQEPSEFTPGYGPPAEGQGRPVPPPDRRRPEPIHPQPAYGPPQQSGWAYPPQQPRPLSPPTFGAPPSPPTGPDGYHQHVYQWGPPPPKVGLWRRKYAKPIGGAIATVLVTILGVVAAYVVAPSQEVASQEALEQHQRLEDAENAPVSIEDVYGNSADYDGPNVASNEVVELDGAALPPGESTPDTASMIPNAVPLGDVIYENREQVSGAKTPVAFTLTGKQNTPTRIRDIRVKVTDRAEAPKGTLIFFPPQGHIDNLKIGFDLDSSDPSARTLGDDEMPTEAHYFRENTVTLAKGEALGFNTIATTKDCACEFVLEIEFSDDRILQIDNNGKPFFLAAYRDDSERKYVPQFRDGEGFLTQCPSMAGCATIAYQAVPR